MNGIREYHLNSRVFQLSQMNDPVYGLTSSDGAFSHDQVPIEISDKNEKTIETTGVDEVYDAVGKGADVKRFCTLNLIIPMTPRADGKNHPKLHVVFKGKYQSADEWHDQNERSEWDEDVVVSFQENAWVDTKTHIHFLEHVVGPLNAAFEELGMRGVVFEDNLASHGTGPDSSNLFWEGRPYDGRSK